MRIIQIIAVILLTVQSTVSISQNVSFYIQIEDSEIIPEVLKDEKTGLLTVKSRIAYLDNLYKEYKIIKFEKAFPTVNRSSLKNVYHIKCDNKKLGEDLKGRYKDKIPRLEYLDEPMLTYEPNDYGLVGGQTNLGLINVKEAWDIILGFPKIDIAISDTYFDLNHEDLDMTLFSGNNSPNVSNAFHGTTVAGCVGAVTDNNIGLASVAFDANLVVTSHWGTDNEVLLLAQAGYRVINCSWINSCSFNSIQEELYNDIRERYNAIVVFGASNAGSTHCGNNNPSYPASYAANVAVTSVGHIHNVGSSQSPVNNNWKDVHEEIIGDSLSAHKHHPTMDICAPGYNVATTDIKGSGGLSPGNYTNMWGTSFSAPQVSGTLGLIISVNPCLSADEAINILLNNADASIYNIPENQQYIGRLGSGRLDVFASVNAAAESATTYLQNMVLSGSQNIETNYAIRVVDNVTIGSGATIDFLTRKEVTIDKNFEIVSGAELTINVNVNNTIDCD